MKAALFFRLPEDEEEHRLALNGKLYKFILDDVANYIAESLKAEGASEETILTLSVLRDLIAEAEESHGLKG